MQSDKTKKVAVKSGLCKSCCACADGGKHKGEPCMAMDHGYGADICPRIYEAQKCNLR